MHAMEKLVKSYLSIAGKNLLETCRPLSLARDSVDSPDGTSYLISTISTPRLETRIHLLVGYLGNGRRLFETADNSTEKKETLYQDCISNLSEHDSFIRNLLEKDVSWLGRHIKRFPFYTQPAIKNLEIPKVWSPTQNSHIVFDNILKQNIVLTPRNRVYLVSSALDLHPAYDSDETLVTVSESGRQVLHTQTHGTDFHYSLVERIGSGDLSVLSA